MLYLLPFPLESATLPFKPLLELWPLEPLFDDCFGLFESDPDVWNELDKDGLVVSELCVSMLEVGELAEFEASILSSSSGMLKWTRFYKVRKNKDKRKDALNTELVPALLVLLT